MLFSNGFALIVNALSTVVYGAISLLIFSQLRRDRVSRALLRLMLVLAAWSFVDVMLRLLQFEGVEVHRTFLLFTFLTALLPYFLFVFVVEYLGKWTRLNTWLRRIWNLCLAALFVILFIEGAQSTSLVFIRESIVVTRVGEVLYEQGPLIIPSTLFVVFSEVMLIYAVQITLKAAPVQYQSRITRGIGILVFGMIIIPLPRYTVEQFFYFTGSLLLIGPVLGQRVFEPLTQANRDLRLKNAQLALITSVGHKAHSMLTLHDLLPDIARQICVALGYERVAIVVSDVKGAELESGSSGPVAEWGPASMIKGTATIPLEIGPRQADYPVAGTMQILAEHDIQADELVILNILAQQIGLAVYNAYLFEQLQKASDAKSAFIRVVSHEMRNGVQVMTGLSYDVLNDVRAYGGVALPDPYREDVESLLLHARYLSALLSDIVDWGQIDSGSFPFNPEQVQTEKLLDDVANAAQNIIPREIVFVRRYPPVLPPVHTDPKRLRQVLVNLIGNAAKFTDEGSITLDAAVDGAFVRFSVADTGSGISDEHLEQLFQGAGSAPYLIATQDGRGLGLRISEYFVLRNGGRIWLESTEGEGTTVYFTVPVA